MINFKNGTSPSTSMNFFKGNVTQQIINQKYPSSGNRKSQSTGRQGMPNRQGGGIAISNTRNHINSTESSANGGPTQILDN